MKRFQPLFFLLMITFFLFQCYPASGLSKKQKERLQFYSPVINSLKDVDTEKNLNKIFLDRRVRFSDRLILLNLDQPKQTKYFSSALRSPAINRGRRFLKKYYKTFVETEKKFSVDKEIIVAILYIETNFRLSRAKYNVFSAYVSLAFANHPKYIALNLKRLKKRYKKLSKKEFQEKRDKFLERSKRKGDWAIAQLKALFEMSKKWKKPILSINGSFAGAIGYPQFIPTSYIKYAVDGNGDSYIDLYNVHDSIASVGSYLSTEGFKSNDKDGMYKAIYHYNRSDDYVNVILDYAKILKQPAKKSTKKRRKKHRRKRK